MYYINYYTDGRENGTDRDIEDFTGTAVHIMQRMKPGEYAEVMDGDGVLYCMERMSDTQTVYESILGTCTVTDNPGFYGQHFIEYEDGASAQFMNWVEAAKAAEEFVTCGVRA